LLTRQVRVCKPSAPSSAAGRGSDRTSKKRREKIEIDKHERAHWKAPKRTGDALPKQVQAVIETRKALVTEAKGLGRAR
jgi:hypothetical protein